MSYELKLLIEEIKKNCNLIEYIKSQGITLSKRGPDRYFVNCPFHNEKTPSMCVNDKGDDSFFHCFGCGENGDIINFYAKHNHLTTAQTISKLGKGVDINLDLSTIVKMLDQKEEKSNEQIVNELNIDISRYLFSYLCQIRKIVSKEILFKELGEIEKFYKELDDGINDLNVAEVKVLHGRICESDFIEKRFAYFGTLENKNV